VKLINTDGMAFIGPGSEWFWTAISGIILAVTFIAIYRQLRQQARASAVEAVEAFVSDRSSERLNRAQLDILVALRDHKDPADLPEWGASEVAGALEKWATLAREGHRDTKLLYQLSPQVPQIWWLLLAPWIRKIRADAGAGFLENLEWLAGVMAEMDRRAGSPAITSARVASLTDSMIASCEEQIRVAQALRTVILVSPEAVTVAQPTIAAPPA
jgi:hypothetical protein